MSKLDPRLLLRGYAAGIFPMADGRAATDIFWVEPRSRAILPLNRLHVSRSLTRRIRSGRFQVTRDRAFAEVLTACAQREETWINEQIERATLALHALGHAHSIEAWRDGKLVGGLYGVKLGGAFFGESMFSIESDASKVALAWLVARMKVGHFSLLDCQFMTGHLASLGAITVARERYIRLLGAALESGSVESEGEGEGGDAGADGASAATARPGRRSATEPDFFALDDLLAARSDTPASALPAPPLPASASPASPGALGQFIVQLLGHTS